MNRTVTLVGLIFAFSAYGQAPQDSVEPAPVMENEPLIDREPDLHPLKPADTSSPRDTLFGFLGDTKRVVDEWLADGELNSASSYRAYSRAASALDFSTTPDGDSRFVQTSRLLMLWEILGRQDLPRPDDIPGETEVELQDLFRWTLPNTGIAIEKIEAGPRKGEYLFSKGTVERLDRYYRMVQGLPSRPDFQAGVYERFLNSQTVDTADEQQIRDRLRPVDRSNPRSTLMGFLESVNGAYAIVTEADAALRSTPPAMTKTEATQAELVATSLMHQAITALDLSEVAPAQRDDVGIERALQLKELLDRMNLPPIDSIPNTEMVAAQREQLNRNGLADVASVRWRYPNAEIEIVEILEGEHQGSFQFSAGTVGDLDDLYERVRDLPYRRDYTQIALDYPSPEVSSGFYESYITTPGNLIPRATRLGRFVDRLPAWCKRVFFGQTAWQWCGLAFAMLIITAVSAVIQRQFLRLARQSRSPAKQWLKIISPVLIAILVFLGVHFVDETLNLTGTALGAVTIMGDAIGFVLLACVVFGFCRAIAETMISLPQVSPKGMDASMLRLSSSVIGALLFVWILVSGFNALGADIIPLIAGLGVGGLAIALAARPTMENIIGSFMIFWDKPFQVGQRVKALGHDGTVESIGLRSTKIRLLSGHITSIPNEKMASLEIENIGRRPYIRRLFNVTITFDSPPEKISRAIEILRGILAVPDVAAPDGMDVQTESMETVLPSKQPHANAAINHPEFPPRVYFSDLNSDSLNLLVIYWYHPADYWDYLEHATSINIQIMERFAAEDIDFALPTQTLHLADDAKNPLTVGQR